ncbi:DUF3267 domain-containing protein [Bacillus solimangrovi]|uniref:Zincin peptidase n=1 Tax=Bacillus solimangrovi TaxID=1305675 RepID=A0A1E5LC92_9BACI|nr:DUF3267 domain-containing protein [Bacillus solimangrovi]OEH91715.1 hypothetical protein BFG57_17935 [Bacillus solimangrovi]
MNCWKTINLFKDYGLPRISILSIFVTLGSFVGIYLPLSLIYSSVKLQDNYAIVFLIGLMLIPMLHQVLHLLPAWLTLKKATMKLKYKFGMPFFVIRFHDSMSKTLILICLGMPLVVMTALFMIGSHLLPQYIHYFSMMSALNIGLSVTDLIYMLLILKAPKRCYIENFNGGYDILINRYN